MQPGIRACANCGVSDGNLKMSGVVKNRKEQGFSNQRYEANKIFPKCLLRFCMMPTQTTLKLASSKKLASNVTMYGKSL